MMQVALRITVYPCEDATADLRGVVRDNGEY